VADATTEFNPERERLTRLQRLLLPAKLPSVGCTEIAAVYRSHNDELQLGGDWYHPLPLVAGPYRFPAHLRVARLGRSV
jgi:serine phosphatase RsbU (regulator of sigma subunit)